MTGRYFGYKGNIGNIWYMMGNIGNIGYFWYMIGNKWYFGNIGYFWYMGTKKPDT
jgi:hypothetical protein